ncbi:protein HYPER-SENSITIVITY-RELATED 4 [Citrus sinensis]|uniref:Protein HYPER-SENSITIVITY-RELATED 4 n=1 Tax=Citrus sinensis TaxID=2711 RepID=A0ACB8LGY4_CITSI|nr:protein HYPER-SENSITIVITY-RELATED 4 [Citrus sinensis]
MFSLSSMPSTSSVLSTYTTFAASAMLVRTILNEVQTITNQFIPQKLQDILSSKLEGLFGNFSDQLTLIIEQSEGFSVNEIYQAAELYLSTRITPSIQQLRVSQAPREKSLSVTINEGQKVVDTFEGMQLTWELVTTENQKTSLDYDSGLYASETAHKSFHLSFSKLFKDKVLNKYLPYVAERSKAIKETKKAIKLYSLAAADAINLDHPSTFDTLAMDPVLKQALIDDLDRFVKRREFYSRVGKAWKRGYLLYGPPGTGKSSLIAAMANYLNIELENRQCGGGHDENNSQVTLSGLLNFVDGLWSSCGDERIIVFTTNYKERLDPALLRPGRMDMHIHMSYLTPSGFKILAFNYLKIKSHSMFDEIEELIKEVEVTPAEVAEELMKSEDADVALNGLVDFLLGKKEQTMKCEEPKVDEGTQGNEEENESLKNEEDCTGQKRKNVNKKKKNKKLKSFSHLLRLM